MKLGDIFIKYYTVSETRSRLDVLETQGLYHVLEDQVNLLYGEKTNAVNDGKKSPFREFLFTIKAITTAFLSDGNHSAEAEMVRASVIDSVVVLIRDACMHCSLKFATFSDIFNNSIDNCNLSDMDKFNLNFAFATQLVEHQALIGGDDADSPGGIPAFVLLKLSWNIRPGEDEVFFLLSHFANEITSELKVFPHENFVAMLKNPEFGLKPRVDADDLCAFLTLFNLLYNRKRIGCSPNRALFCFLKENIEIIGNFRGREDLSKWNFDALTHYATVVKVENKINKIYNRFCPTPEDKKDFDDFFTDKREKAILKAAADAQRRKKK